MRLRHPLLVLTWPTPNYVDPQIRPPFIYPINSIFFAIGTSAVALRLYTRIFIRKWFGPDDVCILIAWLCALCDLSTIFYSYSHFDWDRHMYDGSPDALEPGSKAVFAAKLFWSSASSGIRMSVLFLYYRLLNHIGLNKYRWVLHCNTFMVVGIWLSYFFTTIFACYPVAAYWHWPSVGTCLDEAVTDTTINVFNTLSEVILATLPIPIILWLDLARNQKWSVACLLCLGYFVAIIGSVRTWYNWVLFDSDDLSWWSAPYWVCSETELSIAMLCACAPSLRPLFDRLLARRKVIFDKVSIRRLSRGSNIGSATTSTNETVQGPYSTYSTYWKTLDVEGIGIDGFGYTVTITADGSNNLQRRPSKIRKMLHLEKDLESNQDSNTSHTSYPNTLVSRLSEWAHRKGFQRQRKQKSQSRDTIEINAVRSLVVTEEVVTESVDRSTTRGSAITMPGTVRLSTSHSTKVSSTIRPPDPVIRSITPTQPQLAVARSISPRIRARMVARSMTPVLQPNNASISPVIRPNVMPRNTSPMGQQSLVSHSISPETNPHPEMRSMSPLFQQYLRARSTSPVIQAPIASRRISPRFVNSMALQRQTQGTFYVDSDDESSFVED